MSQFLSSLTDTTSIPVLETLSDGIYLIDEGGTVVCQSRQFFELLELPGALRGEGSTFEVELPATPGTS
ncbi:MAG: hypothetical protein CMO26_00955 [Thiotrichales bacterium]|nr:hypothetical protein [Thiotrichales bacterium]|tara:strand:+ start:254 stop:460 length:207 start_codon:yes stop_codon:yes gene_type:complete